MIVVKRRRRTEVLIHRYERNDFPQGPQEDGPRAMYPSTAATAELRVPTVHEAAAGIGLTTGPGWRGGETPTIRAEPDRRESPLWPWLAGIGFAFLVGWVLPPPGTTHPDGAAAPVTHEVRTAP